MVDSIQSNSHVLALKFFEQSAAIIWTQVGAKNKRMGEIACKAAV
jgi:predicted CoA-binding protein